MRSEVLRGKVRELRASGKTYSEIMAELNLELPKSTMSDWCRGVKLPAWYQEKIDKLNKESFGKAQKVSIVSRQIKQERLLRELETQNSHLIKKYGEKDNFKMLLAMLYLGEGAKWKSHSGLMLGSSDPDIIRLYLRLLKLCYNIEPSSLRCRISYRADQNIKSLQKFWSKVTSISGANFYKTKPDARTIGKPTRKKEYKGVCVVTGGSTRIQQELELIPKLILKGL